MTHTDDDGWAEWVDQAEGLLRVLAEDGERTLAELRESGWLQGAVRELETVADESEARLDEFRGRLLSDEWAVTLPSDLPPVAAPGWADEELDRLRDRVEASPVARPLTGDTPCTGDTPA